MRTADCLGCCLGQEKAPSVKSILEEATRCVGARSQAGTKLLAVASGGKCHENLQAVPYCAGLLGSGSCEKMTGA